MSSRFSMLAKLRRSIRALAEVAGIVAAIYAVLAFHGSTEHLAKSQQAKSDRMGAIAAGTPSPNLETDWDFEQIDLNVKLRLSFERSIAHKPGEWRIPSEIERPMRAVLEGIRREFLDAPTVQLHARVVGTADPIPVADGWRYDGRDRLPLPVRYADDRELRIGVAHGSLLTNEKIACLRAHEAGAIVADALGVQPTLAGYVSLAYGDRYAIVRLQLENVLLDDFNRMNRLERDIARAGFAVERAVRRLSRADRSDVHD
jgi:hypothetical protein